MIDIIIVSILTGIPLGILGGILGATLALKNCRMEMMNNDRN